MEKFFTLPIFDEIKWKTYLKDNWYVWLLEGKNVRFSWNKIKFYFNFTKHKKRRSLEYIIIKIETWWIGNKNKFRSRLKNAGWGGEIRKWDRIGLKSWKQKKKKTVDK